MALAGTRSRATLRATVRTPHGSIASRCIRCIDEPCLHFTADDMGPLRQATQVCPADAIRSPRSTAGPTITNACVGCGICAMRCPVGAISILHDAVDPTVSVESAAPEDGLYAAEPDDDRFFARRDGFLNRLQWSDGDSDDLVALLSARSHPLRQGHFYPLVAALFTIAGFPAWRPVQGDTNNRIDLILVDEQDSLPVEVKSQTEVSAINVKSVQQALENKIILDQRAFLPSQRSSSTLVVGYAYPPVRSDVSELVEDVHRAYGIRIGLISIPRLYALALQRITSGSPLPRTMLNSLKGPL